MQQVTPKKIAAPDEEKLIISKLTELSSVPVDIRGILFEKTFVVKNVAANKIQFENVDFAGFVSIEGSDNPKIDISFINCNFNRAIFLSKLSMEYIEFVSCTFDKLFVDYIKSERFFLSDCKIKYARIRNVKLGFLKATDNCDTRIALMNSVLEQLNIIGNDRNFEFRVLPDDTNDYSKISRLQLTPESSQNGIYSFYKVDIDDLQLTGVSNSYIEFLYCNLNKINIHQFINNSNMKVSGLEFTSNSLLRITGSDFGKLRMFGVDFTQVSKFDVNIININEVVSSGVVWCKSIPGKNLAESKRDVFKQLKNIATKQKDKFQELEYYNLEMDQQQVYLSQQKGLWNDKFILCFNKHTNNHGLSWMRPLGLIAVNVVLFYFIIKVLLGFDEVDLKYTSSTLSEILECFSPVRKFSDSFGLKEQTAGSTSYYVAKILDIIFLRLFLGLLIFQMVKAFRKYVNT